MDKNNEENNAIETSLCVSDFLDPDLEQKTKFAGFNQLRKIRNLIKKPLQSTKPSLRIFDTENITSNKKSLPFEFDELRNSNNSPEVISISSASSLDNTNRNQALTPRKNLKSRCRKSLFKSIIAQEFKNKPNSTDKTLIETNFNPQTFSTPVYGKKNNEVVNKISHSGNIDLEKDKIEKIHSSNETKKHETSTSISKNLSSRAENNKEIYDKNMNSNINCAMEKNNQDIGNKTINNPVEMEVSETSSTSNTPEKQDILSKKEKHTCYTQKILIDDTLSGSTKDNFDPHENCQHDEPELEKKNSIRNVRVVLEKVRMESLQNIQEDLPQEEPKINKLSKIPRSTTPFTKSVLSSPLKKQVVDQKLTKTTIKNDLSGLRKSTEKPNKSFRAITPPIPIITSPIVINQIFNNGTPDNILTPSQHANFKIIDVQTIPPPPEFQSNTKNKIDEETRDILTEDEDDLMVNMNIASVSKSVTKNRNKTSESICNEKLDTNLSKRNEVLNQITFKNTTNSIMSGKILSDDSIITEDGSKSNRLNEPIDDVSKSNNQVKQLSEELKESSLISEAKTINQKRNSIIPLDLRKKKRAYKKNKSRSIHSKEIVQKNNSACLQDYFPNTDDNIFERLLKSNDKSISKKNERNTKRKSVQNIRWPPNNLNDLGDNKPFAFREINELETAGKRKRYSSQNFKLQTRSKTNNNVQNNEAENLSPRKELQKEQIGTNSEKFTNYDGETPNNKSSFRWPTPPPPLVNNFDSESGRQISPENNEILSSPVIISKRSYRKRLPTVNPSESKNNAHIASKKRRISYHTTNENLPEDTVNNTSLILETNNSLVHDDPTAANKIWSDVALSKSINSNKSSKVWYSKELKKSRDSKNQYVEEYLQLSNRIQSKSGKEKRKLYSKGASDAETDFIQNQPDKITENSTSMKSLTQENSNKITPKKIVPVSSKSNHLDKIKTSDFEFKKPLNPAPRKRTNELKGLLKIHPMYKLQEDKRTRSFIDDHGNEIRRSGRTKPDKKPFYDTNQYYELVKKELSRRINNQLTESKEDTKKNRKKKLRRNMKRLTNDELDCNNELMQNNNEPGNEVEMKKNNQPTQVAKANENEVIRGVESNIDMQSANSNRTEEFKFFNWIMSVNCTQDKTREDDHDLSVDSEGYRLASLNNMIFEERKGVNYALYRTANNSGYMKLLPGVHKPRAKSGRFYLKFLVLAGHITASINNTEFEFEPGDHIEVEKGQMYAIYNKTNEICCLYFTRTNSN